MSPIPFARKSRVPGVNVLEDMNMEHMDNRAAFLDAMKKKNPRLYAFLARTHPELLHVPGHAHMAVASLGATAPAPQSNTSWWQSLLTNIGQAIPLGIQTYQEVAMARAQVHNAVQGKPPIPVQKYVAAGTPTATVQVGVNPDTQKTLIYLGLAALGVFAAVSLSNSSRKGKARSRA